MFEHTQFHRLVSDMDGVPIDKTVVGRSAQSLCTVVAEAVHPLLGENEGKPDGQILADKLWAPVRGISALYMDRVALFDLAKVTNAVLTLIQGARMRQGAPWTRVNEFKSQQSAHQP